MTSGPFYMFHGTFSLHSKTAVCKQAGKLLSLKWKPDRDEQLSTVYRPKGTQEPGLLLRPAKYVSGYFDG